VHFEDVAVRDFSDDEISHLKIVFRKIYESLGSIEPEIEAAKASPKPRRKSSLNRPRTRLRAKE
jgi:hypothetical protein